MTGAPITRQQYREAARRVRLYGNLLECLTFVALLLLFSVSIEWIDPVMARFGKLVRAQFQDEGVVGLVSGLVISVALAPLVLIPLLPALWVDRRYGLKCPHCGRSVTLRCHPPKVLRSGKRQSWSPSWSMP